MTLEVHEGQYVKKCTCVYKICQVYSQMDARKLHFCNFFGGSNKNSIRINYGEANTIKYVVKHTYIANICNIYLKQMRVIFNTHS